MGFHSSTSLEEPKLPEQIFPLKLDFDITSQADRDGAYELSKVAEQVRKEKQAGIESAFLVAADSGLSIEERTKIAIDGINQLDDFLISEEHAYKTYRHLAHEIVNDTTGNAERINIHKTALVIGHALSLYEHQQARLLNLRIKNYHPEAQQRALETYTNQINRIKANVLNVFGVGNVNVLVVNPKNREGKNLQLNLQRDELAKQQSVIHKLDLIEKGRSNEAPTDVNISFYRNAEIICVTLIKKIKDLYTMDSQKNESDSEDLIITLKALQKKAAILRELSGIALNKKSKVVLANLE